MKIIAGKILARVQVDVISTAALDDLQHIAAGQGCLAGAVVGDLGEIDRVARAEAENRIRRNGAVIDFVTAAGALENDRTTDDTIGLHPEDAAVDEGPAGSAAG